jgi:hypothetical protein
MEYMARRKSVAERVRSLKAEIRIWVNKHDLAQDTFWKDPPAGSGEGENLVLVLEGDLSTVLWERPFDDHDAAYSRRLRQEFDAIVKKHGFYFEFQNEGAANFYLLENL